MDFNSSFRYIGVSQIAVATSFPTTINPPPRTLGCRLIHSAGGTLSFVASTGGTQTLGCLVPFQTQIEIPGAAQFYLAAAGAAATVGIAWYHSCGFTQAQNPNATGL